MFGGIVARTGLRTAAVIAVATALISVTAAAVHADPVPSLPAVGPTALGAAAVAHPVTGIPPTPQHPFLAPNQNSGIHNDGWQTDTYTRPGPLGRDSRVRSQLLGALCGSITFDRQGRLLTTCLGPNAGLYLLDPVTLATRARYPLPARQLGELLKPGAFQNFGGGGYFYLDNHDRAVIGTSTGHIVVLATNRQGTAFTVQRDIDLGRWLRAGESLNSALPDSSGLLWFVGKKNGVVGTVNLDTGQVTVIRLGRGSVGEIENSFAVGNDRDVYIATNRELLRLTASAAGKPIVQWRVTYGNTGITKPGQVDAGTGTTPTLLPYGYVAITDNSDPLRVVVYRTAVTTPRRQVCAVPVFAKGAGSTENSLIGAGRALIVENNYGYTGPASTMGRTTTPGFARVDIDPGGSGCHKVWTNTTTAAPTAVPKLSLATGLVYSYTKPAGVADAWYWTAIDYRTGATVWRRWAGSGPLFNNNYAGVAIGPSGRLYLGVLGGIALLEDGPRAR